LNSFDMTLFKINITAVYEGYVCTLERVFDLNDDEGIIAANPSKLAPVVHAPPTSTDKMKDRGTFSPKVTWNGKVQTFETFKSTIKSWLIQHSMDYLINHSFIVEYIKSNSFLSAKQTSRTPKKSPPPSSTLIPRCYMVQSNWPHKYQCQTTST